MSKTIITNSFKETQNVGADFAKKLENGGVIILHGDLGSGKTTFVQGLAKGLGIEKKIISPTFIIMRTYQIRSKKQEARIKNFYHIDLYRIENESDIENLGFLELIEDPHNIIAIEWPEKIRHLLPEKRINLFFEYLGDGKRKIVIDP